ncbi:MAG: hypothetical protein IPP72_19115 [Chitinophagaceae bacterium]|nr:hypothetical protein [Chitinophagaceae bacterium]
MYRDDTIVWMPKEESNLDDFLPVQELFYKSCTENYHKMIDDFSPYFFQGFEWTDTIKSLRTNKLADVIYDIKEVDFSYLTAKAKQADTSFKAKLKRGLIKLINKL